MSKPALKIIAFLAVVASITMYTAGNNNPNLTELKNIWWLPLPVAAFCYLLAVVRKTKQ
jgi:hypothetical protein